MAIIASRWKRFVKFINCEDSNGFLGSVDSDSASADVVPVYPPNSGFKTGRSVVFLNSITGLKVAGPVTIETFDRYRSRIKVNSKVTVSEGDAIYESGYQDECGPPKV